MDEVLVIIGRLSESFLLNSKLFALTLIFSLPLGLIISFGSMSRFRPLRMLVRTIVWAVRGTPLMLQLMIIFYGPGLLGMSFSWPSGETGRFVSATVAFV
ncbi:MAG: ABC transporter permease subunit, partial [Clostridiales bacterium]|nr:ABC transporter permease subunit [Clostridiales bacterium]